MEVLRSHAATCAREETTAERLHHDMLSDWIFKLCVGVSKHPRVRFVSLEDFHSVSEHVKPPSVRCRCDQVQAGTAYVKSLEGKPGTECLC